MQMVIRLTVTPVTKLHLPANIPAKLFWPVTLYETENASGLNNGRPFPSLGMLDKPEQNADGLQLWPPWCRARMARECGVGKVPVGAEGPSSGYVAL